MDNYIHKQAGQDIKRSISRVFVAEQPGNSKEVMGYYSLSTLSIELNQLPENLARKLPRHPIPAALIGRLAVSKSVQGYGIGKMLLIDAIKRTLSVSEQIAIYAMVVDAIDDNAKGFYEQYGFTCLNEQQCKIIFVFKIFLGIIRNIHNKSNLGNSPGNEKSILYPPITSTSQAPGLIDPGLYSRRRSRSKNNPHSSPKSRQFNTQHPAPKILKPHFSPPKSAL